MSSASFCAGRRLARALITCVLATAGVTGLSPGGASLAGAAEATIAWVRPTPLVITADVSTWTIEVAIQGSFDDGKLHLATHDSPLPLNDLGRDGDQAAGDGIYSARLDAAKIRGALKPSDVFRANLGVVRLPGAKPRASHEYPLTANVWTADIPRVEVQQVAHGVQKSPHLANLADRTYLARMAGAAMGSSDERRLQADVCRRFYQHFGDDYDFINIIYAASINQKPHHCQVRNAVRGIGSELFDVGEAYGSPRRLQGISVFPNPATFDGASRNYQHELAHQWVNQLRVPGLDEAVPHWPLSDLATGIMGCRTGRFPFELRKQGADYVLATTREPKRFTDLDLYLMGLLPIEAVRPHVIVKNQDLPPRDGVSVGPVTEITGEMIAAQAGPRVPDYRTSPKEFRLATVILSEEPLPAEAMWFYDHFSARAEATSELPTNPREGSRTTLPFYLSTGGRGRLVTHVGKLP